LATDRSHLFSGGWERLNANGVTVARSFTNSSAGNLGGIAKLVEANEVMPRIEAVFPLDEVRYALALSEAGRARGRIVLKVAD
jgi:NADPH:quinone reductase-like Zn-dependent oxidoreductase